MTVDRLIRHLHKRGDIVDLLCFVENSAEDRVLREGLSIVCGRIETVRLPRWRSYLATALSLPGRLPMQTVYFRSSAMRRKVEEMVASGSYDLVYSHLIRMAEYARHLALPKVMGVQISQALNLSRMAEHVRDPVRKLFYRIESAKVRPYEAMVCRDFDRVFLCGPKDIKEIEKTAPLTNAVVCPHGQDIPDIERVREGPKDPHAIAMSGVMATYTNVDAATWFTREILPRVRAQVPEACFWIVGRNPQRSITALARPPHVLVTGEVPDVYDYLCRAAVAVAPLRVGAGMQNKVIQAMACELPVVATSVANEGIGAAPGEEILLRDSPEAFADAVSGLLRDTGAGRRMGERARRFVESHWTWETHFDRLREVLLQLTGG